MFLTIFKLYKWYQIALRTTYWVRILKIFWHLKVTQRFLFFRVNQVYVFKSAQYIFQFTSLDFHIIPRGFRCLPNGISYLPSGKFTPRSHPGKFLKIRHFPRWVKQSPPGYWGRMLLCKEREHFHGCEAINKKNVICN